MSELPMRANGIPMHIVRCVSHSNGRDRRGRLREWIKVTSGWQVRYAFRGKRTKFFSDGKCGGKEAALQCATEYLRKVYRGKAARTRLRERAGKSRPTGYAGIRLLFEKGSTSSNIGQWYVEVTEIPSIGAKKRRWYVGTEATATEQRYHARLALALAYRKRLVRRLRANLRTYGTA